MTDNNNNIIEQWWHEDMSPLAAQLSNGVLNEMKRRIQTSNINEYKNTEGMTALVLQRGDTTLREAQRHPKEEARQARLVQGHHQTTRLSLYIIIHIHRTCVIPTKRYTFPTLVKF
jgi:hypothetical protein